MGILTTIGANIKRHRKISKISQEQLAENAGLHRTYIGSVERGERNISAQNIEKIANALELEAYELLINRLRRLNKNK